MVTVRNLLVKNSHHQTIPMYFINVKIQRSHKVSQTLLKEAPVFEANQTQFGTIVLDVFSKSSISVPVYLLKYNGCDLVPQKKSGMDFCM